MTSFDVIGFAVLAAVPQILLSNTAVMTVLCIELPRCMGMVDLKARDIFIGFRHFFLYCAPEAIGLATVFLAAVHLRLRGDLQMPKDLLAAEVWKDIKNEWPVLMGADTLLCLQSMLRLLIFMSAAVRAGAFPNLQASKHNLQKNSGVDSDVLPPLAGMGATLSLVGVLARVRLYTSAQIYRLEGPLSLNGNLPLFCDLCSVPLLLALSFRAMLPSTGKPLQSAAAIALAFLVASQNYLNLAKDSSMDSLFTLTQVSEFFASLAFLGRAVMHTGNEIQGSQHGRAFVGFVHVLMAFQEALSAYYVLTAFEPSPKLVSAGQPFVVFIWSNLLAFAAYLCAAGLYFGTLCSEGSEHSSIDRTDISFSAGVPKATSTGAVFAFTVEPATPSNSSIEV